jgi:hypothetical protein
MVTYLSGGRIQGSSAPLGDISKTGLKFYYKFDDSGAATRGKIAGGSQGGYTNWGRSGNTNDNLSYDLGTALNNTQWIMRFKLHIEKFELNHGSGCKVAIGMSSTDADTAYDSNQDSITFQIKFASGSSEQDFRAANSSDDDMESNTVEIGTNMLTSSAGKDYWVEVKRTSETAGTVSVGENNDFTTGRTSASLSGLNSSCTGLQYFVCKIFGGGYVDNHIYGDVSEVKIYDNQSSPTTVTYDVEDFMKSTSGWNINGSAIQNIVPQSKDLISSASAIGSSDAVANATIDLEYKAEGTRGVTGKVDEAMSITAGDAKGQASGTNRTDTAFITNTGAVWTICLWVKVDSRVGDQAWLSTTGLGSGQAGLFFRMQNSSGGIYLKFGTGGGTVIGGTTTTQVIPNTNWNFVVGQYDYSNGAIKVSVNNGAFETVATAVISDTTTPYRQLIVGNSPELDNDLNGDMDELSIWNRILTAGEITAIYNSGTGEVLNTVQATGDPEKDSITNVPIGTRYEETDTRKIFRRTIATTAVQGTDNPSLDFDFSSTPTDWNYRIAGSTSHWDNDSSRLNWEVKSAGSGSGADYDLGVAQTENWVLRFKFRIDSSQTGMVQQGQSDGIVIFGLQNYPSTAAYTASTPSSANDSTYAENHQTAQFQLCIKSNLSEGSGKYKFQGRAEVTDSAGQATSQVNEELSDDTDYWFEVRRTSATTFTIKGFTNANYSSNQVGSTATFTVSSGVLDGLRYIHFEEHAQNVGYDSYGGGILTDLEFWGTTGVNAWVEKGTA